MCGEDETVGFIWDKVTIQLPPEIQDLETTMTTKQVEVLEQQAELAIRAAAATEKFTIAMQRMTLIESSAAAARASIQSTTLEAETSCEMLDESRDGIAPSQAFGRLIAGEGWK